MTSETHQIATLFICTTGECNLACHYCSAGAGLANRRALPPPTAERAVRGWLSGLDLPKATLVLTGGEPLLWGLHNLERVFLAARDRAERRGIDLTLGIQSNATLVDGGFISLCQRCGIEPSVSLDGPPHINDLERGRGTTVLSALRRMQDGGICFGVVSCLTPGLADAIEDALDWFRENGLRKLRVNTVGPVASRSGGGRLEADTLFKVKKAIYEHMLKHPDGPVRERNVLRQVRGFDDAVLGRQPAREHCELWRCGAGTHLACLNPDGTFSMCVEKSLTDGLGGARSLRGLRRVHEAFWQDRLPWRRCQACPAEPMCDHGCAAYHKLDHRRFADECEANRMFWKYLTLRR